MTHIRKPIFFDHSGKRWRRILAFATGVALAISILGALFSFSLIALPLSPLPLSQKEYVRRLVPKFESHEEAAQRFIASKTSQTLKSVIAREHMPQPKLHPRSPGAPLSTVIGYYVTWDPQSFASLHDHIDALSYVMPEWFFLKDGVKHLKEGELSFDSPLRGTDHFDKALAHDTKRHNVPLIPMIENFDPLTDSWNWPRLRALLKDRDYQEQLAEDLRDYLLDAQREGVNCGGINIDFEPPPFNTVPESQKTEVFRLMHDELPHFVETVHKVFKPAHLLVTEDIPADTLDDEGQPNHPDFNYEKLSDYNDFVVVMIYDEHSASTRMAGPIAGQDWIEKAAERTFARMDSQKVILGIGNYVLDWSVNSWDNDGNGISKVNANPLSLGEALQFAHDAQTDVIMDSPDMNPHFYYQDDAGDHAVYMLDAVTAYNQIKALRGYEPRGVALWRLGSEDPDIWSFVDDDKLAKPANLKDLNDVHFDISVVDRGKGELMEVIDQPKPGRRVFKTDSDGLITSEKFLSYPSPYVIQHFGSAQKAVALTFDDGPDAKYTPEILKVLKDNNVPGTFFMIGKNAENNTGIVRQCWQQGCEIGNHTFTHPEISRKSPLRAELEVNATEHLIESIIGCSTRLFRPPFGDNAEDTNANTSKDADALARMQRLGYITVGMNIDPKDYESPRPLVINGKVVNRIEHRVLEMLDIEKPIDELGAEELQFPFVKNASHNVILMHDGGGNRTQTVAALPLVIRDLKARGYRFIRVSDLLGSGGRARMFPPIAQNQVAIDGCDRIVFESSFLASSALKIVFLIAIILGVLRIAVVTPLAIIQNRRARRLKHEAYAPPVSVVIPAYNEANVISRTIHAVLASDYPDIHIIVVDDGSTDNTGDVVRQNFSSEDQVTLIRKENSGKAEALNLGISSAETEIIVCLDADTIFAKDTIRLLVRHFDDPVVGAVAGNVKVGNKKNPLTIWQSLEYTTSQNFDRRAYAALNSVAVVPGAVGAWRKSAVLRAGGYETDTLAEDTDLTFRIRLLGYHIRTENDALAYTEVPDTVRSLAQQRFRWAFGTIQSLWKHRRSMFKSRYGAFGTFVMPSMWVYNIFFQAFSPIVDLMVLLSLFSGEFLAVVTYYSAFFVLDFISAMVAYRLDNENPKTLTWLFWQRFFYRQFMYYVVLRSIMAALRGGLVGWGKLQRKASVTLPATKI